MVYHQLLHAVVHENVGEVTAQFLRQFVVTLASDFLHDGIAPLSGHVGEIVLYFFRRENPFIAHLDVVLCRFGVPFSRYLECWYGSESGWPADAIMPSMPLMEVEYSFISSPCFSVR